MDGAERFWGKPGMYIIVSKYILAFWGPATLHSLRAQVFSLPLLKALILFDFELEGQEHCRMVRVYHIHIKSGTLPWLLFGLKLCC